MHLDLRDRRTQLGLALVLLGLLALLGNWGVFSGLSVVVELLLFVAAGIAVLFIFRADPSRIWTLPVAFGLLGIGIASLDVPWLEGMFLVMLGLGFLGIWAVDATKKQWWSIIPAGVLMTLGVVSSYDALTPKGDAAEGPILFLGLAATFMALYLLPSVRQRWAIWPALGLLGVALLDLGSVGGWLVPIALIAVGVVLYLRGRTT